MNDPEPELQQTEPRQVRVFISSTFHDMQAERDALVKRVFPELRRRCRGLQVEFVGVDLRFRLRPLEGTQGYGGTRGDHGGAGGAGRGVAGVFCRDREVPSVFCWVPCRMVTGEAGIGKSALLANWMERFRKEHPEVPVVAHFTGASQEAGEPVAMLRRLTVELSALAGAAAEPSAQWHSLASAFGGQLAAAAAKGPFVLLLDGLDQLAETHNAPDLGWLPRFLPENARLIVSSLEGRALAAWTERGWPVMTLDPLDTDQRRRLIAGYLARHGRSLGAAMVDGIVGDERSANPLYLTVLMEELMVFYDQGKHAEAEPYYRRSVEVFDRMLGAHHLRTVAARMSLGNLLSRRGALEESAAVCGAVVQALEESGQTGHFLYAQCLIACGITLRKQGRLNEAETVLGRAIKADETSQGEDHAATGIGLKAMADLRVDQGRLAEAEQLMERSLAILENALGPEHPNTLAIAKRPLEELRSRIAERRGYEQIP